MRPTGGDAEPLEPAAGPPRRSLVRITPLGLFAAAFLLLVAAAFAVILAQVRASALAPWVSLAFSTGAVAFTVAALVVARRR